MIPYSFSVPESWYDGLYRDSAPCRSAARPFTLLHPEKPEKCCLIIHGYRGYPGEFIRPAEDLFLAGFDVFVPRLPGHGTSGDDFIRSHSADWLGVIRNALSDLKKRYAAVHIVSHSMGTAIAALLCAPDASVGRIVYVSPSFENLQMSLPARIALRLLSPFTPRIKCGWHFNPKYNLHYENAPADEEYLGREYFRYFFTRQLGEYYRIMKQGLKALAMYPHEHIVIYPMRDRVISEPSVALYTKAVKDAASVVSVPNGSHCIFYDKEPSAEEAAVNAVLDFLK